MMICSAAALVGCALAPSFGVLLLAVTVLGVTTVSGQILTPLAGDLADHADRGRVVGIVVSGILTGILVSRTISGLVAGAAGWRAIFAAAAAADVLLAGLLYRAIPPLAPKARLAYPALIASVAAVVRRDRVVRWTMVLGATGFGIFTLFWTSLTFLLSGPPFSYPVSVIGLFGLAGLAGAIAAQRAGRLHDRGYSLLAAGAAWALALVAFIIASFSGRSVAGVLVTVVLLDIAIQASNIMNQSRVLAVSREERSRLNTGSALSCLGLAVWAAGRRGPLVQPA